MTQHISCRTADMAFDPSIAFDRTDKKEGENNNVVPAPDRSEFGIQGYFVILLKNTDSCFIGL